MENRKPFNLRYTLILYNFIQVIFSAWLFYEVSAVQQLLFSFLFKSLHIFFNHSLYLVLMPHAYLCPHPHTHKSSSHLFFCSFFPFFCLYLIILFPFFILRLYALLCSPQMSFRDYEFDSIEIFKCIEFKLEKSKIDLNWIDEKRNIDDDDDNNKKWSIDRFDQLITP